jgi:hypothetical protein
VCFALGLANASQLSFVPQKAGDQVLIVVSYASQAARVRAALARESLQATVVTPATLPERSFQDVYILTVRHWRTVSDNMTNGEHFEDIGLLSDVVALRMVRPSACHRRDL